MSEGPAPVAPAREDGVRACQVRRPLDEELGAASHLGTRTAAIRHPKLDPSRAYRVVGPGCPEVGNSGRVHPQLVAAGRSRPYSKRGEHDDSGEQNDESSQ